MKHFYPTIFRLLGWDTVDQGASATQWPCRNGGKMLEGLGLLGVCLMMALLLRWFLAQDSAPDGNSDGLFALRSYKKNEPPNKNE